MCQDIGLARIEACAMIETIARIEDFDWIDD